MAFTVQNTGQVPPIGQYLVDKSTRIITQIKNLRFEDIIVATDKLQREVHRLKEKFFVDQIKVYDEFISTMSSSVVDMDQQSAQALRVAAVVSKAKAERQSLQTQRFNVWKQKPNDEYEQLEFELKSKTPENLSRQLEILERNLYMEQDVYTYLVFIETLQNLRNFIRILRQQVFPSETPDFMEEPQQASTNFDTQNFSKCPTCKNTEYVRKRNSPNKVSQTQIDIATALISKLKISSDGHDFVRSLKELDRLIYLLNVESLYNHFLDALKVIHIVLKRQIKAVNLAEAGRSNGSNGSNQGDNAESGEEIFLDNLRGGAQTDGGEAENLEAFESLSLSGFNGISM